MIPLNDISDHPETYNKFQINPLPLGAQFGDYEYKVYQTNPEVLVERGKLRYHKEQQPVDQFANPNQNSIVYAPS